MQQHSQVFGYEEPLWALLSGSTCVNTQQPGADERGERLARFGQKGNHPEEKRGDGLLTPIDHKVLVHQIGYDQFEQLARSLCKHPVTKQKREISACSHGNVESYNSRGQM